MSQPPPREASKRAPVPLFPALAVLLLISLAVWAATSCTRPGASPPPPAQELSYRADLRLPARVERLAGTALFNLSEELPPPPGGAGEGGTGAATFFLLLNSRNPTEGILVQGRPLDGQVSLATRASQRLAVSGPVKALPDPTLAPRLERSLGIRLHRDAAGLPLWVDHQAPLTLREAPAVTEGEAARRIELPAPAPGPSQGG